MVCCFAAPGSAEAAIWGLTRARGARPRPSLLGDDLRAIANVVGPKGRVVGVDASDAMLNYARQRARRDGSRNIEFAKGSAYKLSDVPGFGQFDAARIERTIQHLQRPTEALAEMIRAVRCAFRCRASLSAALTPPRPRAPGAGPAAA